MGSHDQTWRVNNKMDVAVNINLNSFSFLLCSIFASNLINCQNQCEVLQPSGWETGLDSSGVRTGTPLGLVGQGTNVDWFCPDSKINIADGKSSWTGSCIENPNTPGFNVFEYTWPGNTWPECECPPRVDTCTMEGADSAASYTMRYTFSSLSSDTPGIEIKVPMPDKDEITTWRVRIKWDLQTVDRSIQITSRSKGMRLERLDFPGYEYELKPVNSSYITDDDLKIDLGFNFLKDAIKQDTKKWHYPCLAKLECEIVTKEETDYLSLAIVMGASVGIIFLIGVCCASCVWWMKNDGSYGQASRLVSAYSIRTIYDKKDMQKVRPYSADSDE